MFDLKTLDLPNKIEESGQVLADSYADMLVLVWHGIQVLRAMA